MKYLESLLTTLKICVITSITLICAMLAVWLIVAMTDFLGLPVLISMMLFGTVWAIVHDVQEMNNFSERKTTYED